jgi:transcription elongation factor Elf1
MINANQTLKCPTCNSNIQIDVKQLLEGAQFHCDACMSVIRLSVEGRNIVKDMKFPNEPGRSGGKK